MHLTQISPSQFIDLDEIYLVDMKADELWIYIKPHPKYPVVLTGHDNIVIFIDTLTTYTEAKHERTKDVTQASQDIMEFPDTGAKDAIQRDDGEDSA